VAEEDDARLTYLMRLRKGHGMERESADLPEHLFDVRRWKDFYRLVSQGLLKIGDHRERWAAFRSLGLRGNIGDPEPRFPATGELLKERRARAARELNVSVRTVMRLEERGLEKLSEAIGEQIGEQSPRRVLARMRVNLMAIKSGLSESDSLIVDVDKMIKLASKVEHEMAYRQGFEAWEVDYLARRRGGRTSRNT